MLWLLAGETAVLAVFLNAEECGCCGTGGTAENHVPPQVNRQLATALANSPATNTSAQINVTVDLTTALPPSRGSGSSSKLPYIFYNGALRGQWLSGRGAFESAPSRNVAALGFLGLPCLAG